MTRRCLRFICLPVLVLACSAQAQEAQSISLLMLGGSGGSHQTKSMAEIIMPILSKAGIDVTYTEKTSDLSRDHLQRYDGIVIYKDNGDLSADQEAALLKAVEGGKGLVAIHCASHCFRNSAKYTSLVGGRFQRHGAGEFRARIIDAQHPAMQGVQSFKSWDETYVHNELAADLRVLMAREESGGYEPYTWVRRQGLGRVFHTALGHGQRTWQVPAFQHLIEQAIRWTTGRIEDVSAERSPSKNYLNEPPPQPLSPADSMQRMHLPEGFAVELFAAEPDIIKPMTMCFDARGRAWIAESTDYPNSVLPPFEGHDRIKICEDTDGDGRADKFTVFAEGLNIPSGMIHTGAGLIVALTPHIVLFRDTNGDDVADEKTILFTGFGRVDTHAVHSNFRYGFDNWIWATVGYSGGEVKVDDQKHTFQQSIFRFRPDGSDFEVLTPTSNNTWGLGISETGDVFASTANNQHHVQFVIPNRYFESVRGWHGVGSSSIEDHKPFHPVTPQVRQVDNINGYTAAAGQTVYTARSFPKEYWNRATFVCEPTGHLVHIDWLVKHGTAFTARDGWNLLASSDPWCAPIETHVGPDGAVWMLDWYNYIIQHNPTPPGFKTGKGNAYVTAQRDKTHGRIYRIVHASAKPPVQPNLDRATPDELVATLTHDNKWQRTTAQQLLVERGKPDVLDALAALVEDRSTDQIGNHPAALHAVWTMHGLGAFDAAQTPWADVAERALSHPAPAVRRAAIDVLPRTAPSAAMLLDHKTLQDTDAGVRLAALLALADMPGGQAAARRLVTFLGRIENAQDRWLPTATTAAAARSDRAFLQAAAQANPPTETADVLAKVARQVAEHYARGDAPVDLVPLMLTVLQANQSTITENILAGLAKGFPSDRAIPLTPDHETQLAQIIPRSSPTAQIHLAALFGRQNISPKIVQALTQVQKRLLDQIRTPGHSDDARAEAAKLLMGLSDRSDTINALLDTITPQSSPTLVQGLLSALSQSRIDAVAPAVIDRWDLLTPNARRQAIAVLLRRPAWTLSLLDAIDQGTVDRSALALEQSQRLAHHPNKVIAKRAEKVLALSGRLPDAEREKMLQSLLPLAEQHGDAALGKTVFEKNCMQCHRFNGVGNLVGPELTGIAARNRADILIDVLDPNRSVAGNYLQCIITTNEGDLLTGRLLAETKTAFELLDAQGQKHVILREDVDDMRMSKLSVMPEGLESLPPEELVGLLDYLTAHGKFLPLPIAKAATTVSTRGMFRRHDAHEERLIFPEWGTQTVFGVPFHLINPQGTSVNNAILLNCPRGALTENLPRAVRVPCNTVARSVHLLSGVSGWGFPIGQKGSVSMIVRLHYENGSTEDHPLLNGVHFADYIRVVDVPASKLAFKLRNQQLRYLSIQPKRREKIRDIELIKGSDKTAPIVMAITVETEDETATK